MTTLEERFWAKVQKGEGCWEWQAAKTNGYGRINVEGRAIPAHRLAYELTNGPIPQGLFVLHSCDNPGCVNPEHLRAGTALDNMLDRSARGRPTGGGRPRERCPKGHADWYVNQSTGWKYCRPCRATYMRQWRHLKTP